MFTNNVMVQHLFIHMFLWFILIMSGISFVVGLGLLLNPERMKGVFAAANHWVSLRHSTKSIAIPRDTGPLFQRHRRLIGAVLFLAATFSLYELMVRVDTVKLALLIHTSAPRAMVSWIVESLYWFMITGNLIAIALGILLLGFQAALEKIESRANRWYSFRHASLGADAMHIDLDTWVARFPRAVGMAIIVGTLGVMIECGIMLRTLG